MNTKALFKTICVIVVPLVGLILLSYFIGDVKDFRSIMYILGAALLSISQVIPGGMSIYTFFDNLITNQLDAKKVTKEILEDVLSKLRAYRMPGVNSGLFIYWLRRKYPERADDIYNELLQKKYIRLENSKIKITDFDQGQWKRTWQIMRQNGKK